MRFVNDFLSDVKFTVRLSSKSIVFTVIAVLSLVLGIGASSAIFSLIYAVLIDPYPYKSADRIIAPAFADKLGRNGTMDYTIPDYLELLKNARTIEDAIAFDDRVFVATKGLPEQVRGDAYSPNGFEFMGVPALLGRTFGPKDIPSVGAPPRVAVLSYLFWQRHFGSNPKVIGQTIELNHEAYDIVGVLPPRFTWGDRDVYVPLPIVPDTKKSVALMLRVRPGVSMKAVSGELQAMTERFAKRNPNAYPKNFKMGAKALNDWLLGKFQGTLLILMAAVGFLLLIACGNVSILLLARAKAREKEVAVRVSLGAGRWRLIQQFLTESVLLSLLGGVLGVLMAYRGVPAIVALMPEYSVPHEAVIHVNAMVVIFTFLISVGTGILFGMTPALQLAQPDIRDAMQESGRSSTGGAQTGRARSLLIIAEVALTMVLLVGAGIALRGFIALTQAHLGFDPTNVMTLYLSTPEGTYKTWESRRIHFQRILEALRSTPGATSAATTLTGMPPWIGFETGFEISGRPAAANQRTLVGLVGGDYFTTLHMPLLSGRLFSEAELQRSEHVALINEEMRKQYWHDGQDPIGLRIRIPEMKFPDNPYVLTPPNFDPLFEVVGVVATARNRGLQEASKPAAYLPYTLVMPPGCGFLIRTASNPQTFDRTFREQIRSIDRDQPVTQMMTLEEGLSRRDRAYPRFSSTLFTLFAAVGLLLAASGIYSVVSFVVTQRTHEFGIRMALGARTNDILRLVGGLTARLMLTGIVIGLAGAFALSRVIAEFVQGWDPKDPVAFAAVTLLMLGVGVAACWIPAQRAAAVEPMISLRHE